MQAPTPRRSNLSGGGRPLYQACRPLFRRSQSTFEGFFGDLIENPERSALPLPERLLSPSWKRLRKHHVDCLSSRQSCLPFPSRACSSVRSQDRGKTWCSISVKGQRAFLAVPVDTRWPQSVTAADMNHQDIVFSGSRNSNLVLSATLLLKRYEAFDKRLSTSAFLWRRIA